MNVDTLDVQAGQETYQRFDRFNKKYNPFSQSELREVFLKTDNFINGRYLGELTKEVLVKMDENKYEFMEPRVSIYGKNMQEWSKMADWMVKYDLFSHHVRWMIQVPRLYQVKLPKFIKNNSYTETLAESKTSKK